MSEPVPPAGSVDVRRLVQVLRNALQSRQPENHPPACCPEPHDDQRRLRKFLACQPRGTRQPEPVGQRGPPHSVDQPELGIQHPYPQNGIRYYRHDGRQEVNRAVPGHSADFGVQQHRNRKPGRQPEGQSKDREESCVIEGLGHERPIVGQELSIVLQTDPSCCVEHVVVTQTKDH